VVTEEILLKLARYARAVTGKRNLCLAGGVALNCVANGKILKSGIFDDVWIQPAAGDAGGALGAALYAWYGVRGEPRVADGRRDGMRGGFLGPAFPREKTRAFLETNALPCEEMAPAARDRFIAERLAAGQVVCLLQGRMEFGPRALGNRSILADARSERMQSHLNLATKFRESFRPFAPIVLKEDAPAYFESVRTSPYMLFVDTLREEHRLDRPVPAGASLAEWVNMARSTVPAVTHVDHTARVQTVDAADNARLHAILTELKRLTGCPLLINTSFNVRSEPIVCTPEDAYRCFMRAGTDVLVLDDFVLLKERQPPWVEGSGWQAEFGLD
jgi:carbamoyltransferase